MGTISAFVEKTQYTQKLGTDVFCAENLLDFSKTNAAISDVVQALKVPANTIVKNVWCIVKTPEGSTAVATLGDGASATGWDASVNLNAAAGTMTGGVPGTDAFASIGKFYASEDTIDLVPSAALDTCKLVVKAEFMKIERYA